MHPVVQYGTEEMKQKYLPQVAKGDLHVAFGVTEPDAGTDTTAIPPRRGATATTTSYAAQGVDDQGAAVPARAVAGAHHPTKTRRGAPTA